MVTQAIKCPPALPEAIRRRFDRMANNPVERTSKVRIAPFHETLQGESCIRAPQDLM
jgi:hypothetical protein